jgi:hypothetical protein
MAQNGSIWKSGSVADDESTSVMSAHASVSCVSWPKRLTFLPAVSYW